MNNKVPTWLDCDPGIDDMMAIILASYNPKIQLLGISSAPGNSYCHKTARNALKVLTLIKKDHIQVLQGSSMSFCQTVTQFGMVAENFHGKDGLLIELESNDEQIYEKIVRNDFEDKMYNYFKQHYEEKKQKISLVAVGPVTNIAYVIKKYPDFCQYVEQIVIMGGAIGFGNITKYAEFNIWSDPVAANLVLKQKDVEIVMVPLNATHMIRRQESYYQCLEQKSSSFICEQVYKALRFYQKAYHGYDPIEYAYPPCHDDFTLSYLINKETFKEELMRVMVMESGERKGETQQTDDQSYSVIKVILGVTEDASQVFNQTSLQAVLDASKEIQVHTNFNNNVDLSDIITQDSPIIMETKKQDKNQIKPFENNESVQLNKNQEVFE